MNIKIDFMYLVAAAFTVSGILEYVKSYAKTAPVIIWQILLPVICAGVAIAADGGVYQIITNALIILALSQLAYQAIIKSVKKAITKVGQ